MKVICKFKESQRYCDISGVFVEDKAIIDYALQGEFEVIGGELAGKHSEIFPNVSYLTLKIVSDNQAEVEVIERLQLENGFNPFDYQYYSYTEDGEPVYWDTLREYIFEQLK